MDVPYIRRVVVENMHGQFDVDMGFEPGLNVLYGKNGRGKTTLVHVISNALEQDFERFRFLKFDKIRIESSKDGVLEIFKDEHTGAISVFINGSRASYESNKPEISAVEKKTIADEIGGIATYLPAFRSVLERSRRNARPGDPNESEFDRVFNSEMARLHGNDETPTFVYEHREQASNTAMKTATCRQWFGMFVPVIRYPSVADVEEGLGEEWSSAQTKINRSEQRMFEDTFLKIFRSIAGWDTVTVKRPSAEIIASIQKAITSDEGALDAGPRGAVFDELVSALQSPNLQSEGNNALLEIYNDALQERNSLRVELLENSRAFEASVNKFLDKKTLKIGRPDFAIGRRTRRLIGVTSNGKPNLLGLSSLSSGERQIITILYSASRAEQFNGPLLIDEPELSLHVDWQRIILRELERQAEGRQIIACTHSPEVGADHFERTQDFEPFERPAGSASFADEILEQ